MEIHHQDQRIKPILNRSLCLQNTSRYNEFIIRRPKTTLNFKFLKKSDTFIPSDEYFRKIQTKLHKALKLLKSVRKLDLSEFLVRDSSISQARLLSIVKRVSKAEFISMKRLMDPSQLPEGFLEKWLGYLPRILHLDWGLLIFGTKNDVEHFVHRKSHIRNPLKYLHYCPKIQSLKIDSSEVSDVLLQKALKIKRYPPSLKCLGVKPALTGEQLDLDQKNFQQLGFTFDPNQARSIDSMIYTINFLSNMTDLREIDFRFIDFMIPGMDDAFGKIAQERKLNTIKLSFDFEMRNFSKSFQSLKACPIMHFSIQTYYIKDQAVLEAISGFIQDMPLLESFHITLINPTSFKEADPLKSLCQQATSLRKLRHLELFFKSHNDHIKDFVLELEDISIKHLKLETFSLHCTQINSPRPFSHFITQLENSYNSLQKLTLGLENHFPNEEKDSKIVNFIKKLENIRELNLPRLDITSMKFLNEMVQTIQPLKYLRSFQLGKISNELPAAEFAKAFGVILCKNGLREFYCLLDQGFLWQMQGSSPINIKKILRINPYLEKVSLSPFGFPILAFKQIQSWG